MSTTQASVRAVTWVFSSLMMAMVLLQVTLKLVKHRALQIHDYFIIAALALGLGEAIAVTEQVAAGLGTPEADVILSGGVNQFQQAGYASQMLYVGALGLSKMSSACGSARMSGVAKFVHVGLGLMTISTLWCATAFVSAALQCNLSGPWQIIHAEWCFDQTTFWIVIGVIDLVLDFALFGLPWRIIQAIVGVPWSSKAPLMLAFGSKLLILPVMVVRLLLLHRTKHVADPTWSWVPLVIATQVQMNLSILTSSIPYVKVCATGFEKGLFSTSMRLSPGSHRTPSKPQDLTPLTIRIPDKRHLDPTANPSRHLSVRGSVARSPGVSSLGSSKMFINKLTTFWVEEEPAAVSTPTTSRGPYSTPPVPRISESFYEA